MAACSVRCNTPHGLVCDNKSRFGFDKLAQTHLPKNWALMHRLKQLSLALLLCLTAQAQADVLYMKNGSRLVGKLISSDADIVIFETPFAGAISIKEENILRIATDETVTVMLNDETVYRDRQIVSTEESMTIKTAEGREPIRFASSDIKMVNPEPWKLGDGVRWSGRASMAVEIERGNSFSDEYDFAVQSEWRRLEDRYTFESDWEYDKTKGIVTTNNWSLLGKYDRFFRQHFEATDYYGGKTLFEFDEFADLDLRTTIGPYIGRQFFDRPHFRLRAELGPVHVWENFSIAPDDSWWGASWIVKAESDIIGFGSTIYFDHNGTQNFEKISDLILNTIIGVRFPLFYGFETAIEAEWEYDGGAVMGIQTLDETYTMQIGYSW